MSGAYIIAAKRTPVAPRGGGLARVEAWQLGAETIRAVLDDAGMQGNAVDTVIMGNALYGGGNPARMAALEAGLPETVPALSVDTQCCSGLDAIALAASRISAGDSDVILAGGLESYSRAPIRQRRPLDDRDTPEMYERPPFSPWPSRDPDMLVSAATLAAARGISRSDQEAYAVESHRRAAADDHAAAELVSVAGVDRDAFTRAMTLKTCARLPVLAGSATCGLTAATTAVEADAAAVVLVVSERVRATLTDTGRAVAISGSASVGGNPETPALAPITAIEKVCRDGGWATDDFACVEMMEAFAVQAMACIDGAGLDPSRVNLRGGALARGHPIGASGAILAVRLWHDLVRRREPGLGLAAIAAAGGLGSAMVLSREHT